MSQKTYSESLVRFILATNEWAERSCLCSERRGAFVYNANLITRRTMLRRCRSCLLQLQRAFGRSQGFGRGGLFMVPRKLGHRCTTGNFSSNEKARGASKTRGSCERHCADGERWARHGCKRAPSLLLSRARLPIISDGFAMTAAIANNRASHGASLAHLSLFLDCCMNAACRLVCIFAC